MDYIETASKDYEQYKKILNWKKQQGLISKWAENERFKSGDQWPRATDRTKNLPRPVFNIIEYIENHKTSQIVAESIKMIFTPMEGAEEGQELGGALLQAQQGSDMFTKYSETTWENIKQDELNDEALEDCANTGTCLWHYYWDTSKQGGINYPYIGDMAGEVIDAANYFPGNPQQKSIQKQPFIIISKRDLVSTVKEEAKNNKIPPTMIELITPDDTSDETYDTAKQEIVNDEKVTVFIKYWKKDGYIYFRKFTSTVVIKEDTNTGFTIYPLADMKWKIRKKSSFGRSETEDLIPNQKAINLLLALQLLSVQLTGFPKVLYKEGAINPSQWTNEIGGFIADRSGLQQGWGAQYMNPGTVTPLAGDLTEKFLDYTKTLSGATETSTGSLDKAGQFNAQAIMLLQQAAGVPIEKIKKRYHQAMEDIGRIWEQFWKVKYNTTRMVQIKDEEGNPTYQPFNGSNYTDIDMQLKIDIGPSTSYSDSLSTATLDKLYDKGAIGTVMYLKYSTKAVAPFKDSLIKEIQQQQEAPPDVNKVLSQLTPQEQQAFMRMTPQQQQAVIQQAGMNNMQSNTVKTA